MRSAPTWHKTLALGIACLLAAVNGPTGAAEDSPATVKRTAERTIDMDAQTQKAVDAWAEEERGLLEEIDQKERALKRIVWERERTVDYLDTMERKISELREKAAEMEKINAELLPILDRGLRDLTECVREDLPFDKTRRIKRIEDAAHALKDYDVGLLAKARVLFDALAHEVDFGYSVDVRETEITVEERPTRVKLLKVGRVGLFALTMDAKKAYTWSSLQNQYVPAYDSARAVDEAIQIVERIRIIELTRLPVGTPPKVP